MRVTRLYLQNYRVFEEPVELELPPGLVGVYGLNGSGKSSLLESIRWALFGRARTSLDQVRTSGVKAECVAEVEFEHEGHLYLVRRAITGSAATVKARAHADGAQVAEGPRDTARYVHSVLGMDDVAFRASVFAEQKQLAALSQKQPEDRRKLVLQLLGITPVDAARERARAQARDAAQAVERLRSVLPSLDAMKADAAEQAVAAQAAAADVVVLEARAVALVAEAAGAEAAHDRLDSRRQEHELVAGEAAAVQAESARAAARVDRLAAELADLERAAEHLARLAPDAARVDQAEARLRAVQAVAAAVQAVSQVPVPDEPEPADEAGAEAVRLAAEAARTRLAEVDGALRAATEERKRAAEALQRSSRLSGEGDCPLCGQALGDAFEQVQAHRAGELAEVQARVAGLTVQRRALAEAAQRADELACAEAAKLRTVQASWAGYERARARRAEAERALAAARGVAGGPGGGPGDFDFDGDVIRLAELAAEARRLRKAAEEVERLKGRLERRPRLVADLDAERLLAETNAGRLAALTEKLAEVAFEPQALASARVARDRLRAELAAAQQAAHGSRLHAARSAATAEAAAQRVADAEAQHAALEKQVDEARHLHRLGELLGAFRNGLVARVGPRLSAQAADLFAELTDHEYDDLQVDPDTYEIRVFDQGHDYGMDRFSGSETDLANLALRVAISEHIQFQSGGTVGLLVLDEVFGPLDDDRKERMLLALERLRGRFRQVLVVTHDAAIKEQLSHAIEVVKQPGRRATVRPVAAG